MNLTKGQADTLKMLHSQKGYPYCERIIHFGTRENRVECTLYHWENIPDPWYWPNDSKKVIDNKFTYLQPA